MDLGLVVQQLRQYATLLNGQVAIAVDFEKAIQQVVDMPEPFAILMPLDDEASDNEEHNTGLRQFVKERVAIITSAAAFSDRRGQTAALTIDDIKFSIHSAILNWNPDPKRGSRGFQYAGGRVIDFDRARLFYQFEYEWTSTISDYDGFQPTAIPLTKIDLSFQIGSDIIGAEVIYFEASGSATLPRPIARGSMGVS